MAIYLETLGCKLSQTDSADLVRQLTTHGYAMTSEPAEARVMILSACTVTARADQKALQRLRHLRRLNPSARMALIGCLAENPDLNATEGELIDATFGPRRLGEVLPWVVGILGPMAHTGSAEPPAQYTKSRAFVKVQDGCDAHCAYCIVPKMRGPSRSRSPREVLDAVRLAEAAGLPEVVLTGIHVGKYAAQSCDLVGLMGFLLGESAIPRFRISSIEPREVTPALLELMAGQPRLAPHLHIPLQSGSDYVLAAMNRDYTTADFAQTIAAVREALPHVCVGTDLIVGHPGEDDAAFAETMRFLEAVPLDHFHVFRYSPRPGTPSAERADRPSVPVAKERSRVLLDFAAECKQRFLDDQVGRELEVVPIRRMGEEMLTLSGNYCEVLVPWEVWKRRSGPLRRVRIAGVRGVRLVGEAALG